MTEPQVAKSHYALGDYVDESRFTSYYWQLEEILSRHPQSVLEVGVGDGVCGSFLTKNSAISYTSLDIAADLHPDVLGSVTALPFKDKTYDIACAFEVLEHLPFEEFDTAVQELVRVAKQYVILSLPHFGPMVSLSFKIPFLPLVRMAVKIPYPRKHIFNGQHYWEIGKKGYPLSRIKRLLETHGMVVRDFVPFNTSYHHFFVLDVSNTAMQP